MDVLRHSLVSEFYRGTEYFRRTRKIIEARFAPKYINRKKRRIRLIFLVPIVRYSRCSQPSDYDVFTRTRNYWLSIIVCIKIPWTKGTPLVSEIE